MSKIIRDALYPGSFDPITNGHIDVIKRAVRLFDHIIIGIGINADKTPLFSQEERVHLLQEILADIPNVSVVTYSGLLVDAVKQLGVCTVIRGLRAVADFEWEFQMALMNRELDPECETLFLMPSPKYSFISSTMIKQIATLGGDISEFVPPKVIEALKKKYHQGL